jgi:hypothetical protein
MQKYCLYLLLLTLALIMATGCVTFNVPPAEPAPMQPAPAEPPPPEPPPGQPPPAPKPAPGQYGEQELIQLKLAAYKAAQQAIMSSSWNIKKSNKFPGFKPEYVDYLGNNKFRAVVDSTAQIGPSNPGPIYLHCLVEYNIYEKKMYVLEGPNPGK